MGKNRQHNQSSAAARMAMRNAGVREIVELEGGNIVRLTGRKDRHSKVCTAKGPRDRRVRLSAHTAIKFYDVQDRLNYDRPSKAVDWLIKSPPLMSSSSSLDGSPLQQTLTRLHSMCLMMGAEVLLEAAMKEDRGTISSP